MRNEISQAQQQTEETFGFKWKKRDTYESPAVQQEWKRWLLEKYFDGDPSSLNQLLSSERGEKKKLLNCYGNLLISSY